MYQLCDLYHELKILKDIYQLRLYTNYELYIFQIICQFIKEKNAEISRMRPLVCASKQGLLGRKAVLS